ncbi:Short-chain dehydrogenase [Parapedobacter composti]|uniref:Short-chain dehydrogenase n=1 Tax=Parapedobacter composti TaxID=623281 RepID=A0A1I1EWW6_9SPHI|nr:SDR family oxidoreductase [Parapedobacter composti]SFB91152.1 Short-chain dehydrogenase [Parapedobacter composti]
MSAINDNTMANIVITGTSSGIGFETALHLAVAGHQIVALARSADGLARLAEAATLRNAGACIHPLPFDMVHGNYTDELLPFVQQQLGRVDILINNAGTLINKPFMETTATDFSRMMATNLIGPATMIQQLLPLIPAGGHIVNIGSMGGFQGSSKFPGLSAYSASKGALHTLTECLAAELQDQAIKINCLALGSAQTEMLAKAFPHYKSPVSASAMGEYIAQFALTGHRFFNGKVLPVAVTTP